LDAVRHAIAPRHNDRVAASEDRPVSPRRRLKQSKGRMEAFSDAVFAVAITLLVLDLAVSHHAGHDLVGALLKEWPAYLGFLVSFATIGAIWLGHNSMTDYLERVDSTFLRLNLLLLFFVCLLPFGTGLLAEFSDEQDAERVASVTYGIMLLLCSVLLSLLWRYAGRAKLLQPDLEDDEITLLTHRLTPGLGGYVLLILLGAFFPKISVFGYLAVAVFLLLPFRPPRRMRERLERRRSRQRSRQGSGTG
jgi:uncharacterized membrane protein